MCKPWIFFLLVRVMRKGWCRAGGEVKRIKTKSDERKKQKYKYGPSLSGVCVCVSGTAVLKRTFVWRTTTVLGTRVIKGTFFRAQLIDRLFWASWLSLEFLQLGKSDYSSGKKFWSGYIFIIVTFRLQAKEMRYVYVKCPQTTKPCEFVLNMQPITELTSRHANVSLTEAKFECGHEFSPHLLNC